MAAVEGERVRRWLGPITFAHRGEATFRIVPLGIVVHAMTPEELDVRVDDEIVNRTRGQRAS